jgi:hypothetical protein
MAESMAKVGEGFPDPALQQELLNRLGSVHLVGPCACLPVGTDVRAEANNLRRNFIVGSLGEVFRDRRQTVVNLIDNGEPAWEFKDLLMQAMRCVASSLPEIVPYLPAGVEVNVHAGNNDRAIPYDLVAQAVQSLRPGEIECLVRMLEIEGAHGIAVTSSTSLAHLLMNWPGNRRR